jgi:hypothetical protein
MSKLNLLLYLNSFEDSKVTNNPSLNNLKWTRDVKGIDVANPIGKTIQLISGASDTILAAAVTLSADLTTTYDIALVSGSSTTYRISHNSGTLPVFRTARVSGADATSKVTITKNAKLLTFTATVVPFALVSNGVVVGDYVRVGSAFAVANQGVFKIISRSATSFVVENELGILETDILLGSDFADDINIYSAAGVQIGDSLEINNGFSLVTLGTYEISDVSHNYVEFYCADALPQETAVSNNPAAFVIYRNAAKFLFVETDSKITITINGGDPVYLETMLAGTTKVNGMFLLNSTLKSVVLSNPTLDNANVTYYIAQ